MLFASALTMIVTATAHAQGGALPWGQNSDALAWETFVQATAPSGNPQQPGVEFESWASDQDIYQTTPPRWPAVGEPKKLRLQVSALAAARHGVRIEALPSPSDCGPPGDKEAAHAAGFPAQGCIGEEVRRNWASFQYIVSNGLNSTSGLAKAFQNKVVVSLPADAIEFKGDWVKVSDVMKWLNLSEQQVKQQYYTNTAQTGSQQVEFALVSFHFSTKQIGNWVWADFEHQNNPGRCDVIGCNDSFGATTPAVAPNATPWKSYGACAKTPAVLAMFSNGGINSVWQNYCLKGSQISFVNAANQPVLLGNSVIEAIDANVPVAQSSCMTCHAYASFGTGGAPNTKGLDNLVGNVDQSLLNGSITNDFIWGVLFAR
jgi:hypothetical protein